MVEQIPTPPPVVVEAPAVTPAASDVNPQNPPTPVQFAAKTTLPWTIIHELVHPIPLNGKDWTHICLQCLYAIENKTSRQPLDWQHAVMCASNTSNAYKHLKTHETSIETVQSEALKDYLRMIEAKKRDKYNANDTAACASLTEITTTTNQQVSETAGRHFHEK